MDVFGGALHESAEESCLEPGSTEACMVEGYFKDDCIAFITKYVHSFEGTQRRV